MHENALSFKRWRATFLASLADGGGVEKLGELPWSRLAELEIFPGSRLGSQIAVPVEWLPSGPLRYDSQRTVDPTLKGLLQARVNPIDARREEAVRRCLLALWLPRHTSRGTRTYKPSSWLFASRILLQMAKWSVSRHPSPDGTLFQHLGHPELVGMVRHFTQMGRGTVTGETCLRLLESLSDAGGRGHLSDYPRFAARSEDAPTSAEASLKDVTVPDTLAKEEDRNYQPFPDAFVSELLGRALWIQQNLADQVIDVWARLRILERLVDDDGIRRERSRAEISAYPWRDAEDRVLTELPFDVTMRGSTSRSWPPDDEQDLAQWITIIQGLNIHLLAFCTGARKGEIGSATDASVKMNADGTASFEALTTKITRQVGGELRKWPLHPEGVRALRIQCRLARVVRPTGTSHVWVTTGIGKNAGQPLLQLAAPCLSAVAYLGLTDAARSDRARHEAGSFSARTAQQEHAHLHRWRHTVARLVALTIVGAPQILLDLFGHSDLNMTLRYMLSDMNLQRDARLVAEEMTMVMAEHAIQDAEQGNASGPAAAPLLASLSLSQIEGATTDGGKSSADDIGMRHGKQSHGYSRWRDLARALTVNGRDWQLVRPGVICTKAAGEFGPCTKGWGRPDPGACRTTCTHRLETEAAKLQCRQTLDALLQEHVATEASGRTMILANLRKQIRSNLERWDDVRADLLASSQLVRDIWEEAAA